MRPVQGQTLLLKEKRLISRKILGPKGRHIMLHREARQLSRGMIDTDPTVGKGRTRQRRKNPAPKSRKTKRRRDSASNGRHGAQKKRKEKLVAMSY